MTEELTDEQIAFFKENGFLILRGVLDVEMCARADDLLWEALPPDVDMDRSDRSSHVGPFRTVDETDDPLHTRLGNRWQLRTIGTHQTMIDLLWCPPVVGAAESLLGVGKLVTPLPGGSPMGSHGPAWPGGPVDPSLGVDGVRGVYCTLPYGDVERLPDEAHTDGNPMMLGAVALIDDVLPDGGGFKVWPRSHRRLYPLFWMQYDQPRIPYYPHLPTHKGILHPPEYHDELAAIVRDTEPVDCFGSAGDVVLWHHRLAHMAGHNYTDQMRKAVLADFNTTELDQLRLDPPQENMWRDWSDRIGNNEATYSDEFAQTQGLGDTRR